MKLSALFSIVWCAVVMPVQSAYLELSTVLMVVFDL